MRVRILSLLLSMAVGLGLATTALAQDCQPGLFAHGEFLYMRARTSPSAYSGLISNSVNGGINAQSIQLRETEYGEEPGFRAGVGFLTGQCWDVSADYTYFRDDGNSATGALTDNDLTYANLLDRSLADNAGLNGGFDDGLVDYAIEDLSLSYDLYDITIGRYFRPVDGLVLRAFGGFRGAEIQQGSQVQYINLETIRVPGDDVDRYDLTRSVDMDGIGCRFGGVAHWTLGCTGYSVMFRAAGSMIHADMDIRREDSAINASAGTSTVRRYNYTAEKIVPVLELALGSRYEIGPFFFGGGYEFTNWFGLFEHLDVPGWDDVDGGTAQIRADRGDLALSGWFAECGFIW